MSSLFLMPRLSALGVRFFQAEVEELPCMSLAERLKAFEKFTSYGASGGTRIPSEKLVEFRGGLVELARSEGFPHASDTAGRARYDARCTAWLHEGGVIQGGEALRDDVWAFVACGVAPDVALWRFEGAHPDRFRGGVRNTFQRLWMRGAVLDEGAGSDTRWDLVEKLSEDAFVQITERPAIGSDSRIARAIAHAWIVKSRDLGQSRMQSVTRYAVRRLRVVNETVCLTALSDEQLAERLSAYFDQGAFGVIKG